MHSHRTNGIDQNKRLRENVFCGPMLRYLAVQKYIYACVQSILNYVVAYLNKVNVQRNNI